MSYILTPRQNLLLAALPEKDYERLQPSLELVALSEEWSVYENGSELDLVYFPITSVISLLTISDTGEPVKIAVIGNEGVFGISMLMGKKIALTRATVLTSGYSYRLRAANLRSEFELGSPLRYLLQRYTQALTTRIAQTAMPAVHPAARSGASLSASPVPAARASSGVFTYLDQRSLRVPLRSTRADSQRPIVR